MPLAIAQFQSRLLQQSLHLTTAYMDLALAFYKRPGQRSG